MTTQITARVVADSQYGDSRVTTLELEYPRFILPELNTHRVFSRNTASSRAIPTKKILERVRTDPAMPIEWGTNKPGMQAGESLSLADAADAERAWRAAASAAADRAQYLADCGLHKQIVNRVVEPFMWARTIVTSTEWDNFFHQRISPLAQPEMQVLAESMWDAIDASDPDYVRHGEWHTPYVTDDERREIIPTELRWISAARCARVSYLTHDGERDIEKDVALYYTLVKNGHWSPLEHVCMPDSSNSPLGNLAGWQQLRHLKEFQ